MMSLGRVAQTLFALIQEQVKSHGVVVWFDPEGDYEALASTILSSLSDVTTARFAANRGFLALRHDLEPLWSADGDAPPRLVIYVPGHRPSEIAHALIEYTSVGQTMAPGQQPPECDTALSAVARRTLTDNTPEAAIEKFVKDIEQSRLSLDEIEQFVKRAGATEMGQLTLIYESVNLEDVILLFLADRTRDAKLEGKPALSQMAELLHGALELPPVAPTSAADVRAAATRLVLVTELVEALGLAKIPPALKGVKRPTAEPARAAAVRIARAWRQRRDLVAAYGEAAAKLEAELQLATLPWPRLELQRVETFKSCEAQLQSQVEEALLEKPTEALLQLARDRVGGFWSAQDLETKSRWKIIWRAGEVLMGGQRLEREAKLESTAAGLLLRYSTGDAPWCALDTAFRLLESERQDLQYEETTHDGLMQLVSAAEQRYVQASAGLIEKFVHLYEGAKFDLPGFVPQATIFRDFVAAHLDGGPTAYVLVDAFRYEMARAFAQLLPEEYSVDLRSALATAPTFTEVGMAALLPGAERSLALTMPQEGVLRVAVNGTTLKTSKDRLKLIANSVSQPVEAVPLDKVAPLSDKKIRQKLSQARLIVVTASDEIDGLWESNPSIARRLPEIVFEKLRNALRGLFGLGVQRVVITADHGYLLGINFEAGEGMEAPGGKTAVLKRRVWVGQGGSTPPGALRQPLSAFGLGGPLELVTPYHYGCLSSPGQLEYFHGGLSPQELLIPILVVAPGKYLPSSAVSVLNVEVKSTKPTITTRAVTAVVQGVAGDLVSQTVAPRVQVQLRDGEQLIAIAAAATYGYHDQTHDIDLAFDVAQPERLAPNTITFVLPDRLEAQKLTIQVIDAVSGKILCTSPDIPVDIAL